MAQYARPSADVSISQWTGSYADIDEATPDDAVAQGEWRQTLTLEVLSPGAALGPRRQASLIVADNDYSLAPAQAL